jgi:hypothetical protein
MRVIIVSQKIIMIMTRVNIIMMKIRKETMAMMMKTPTDLRYISKQ